MHDWVAVSVTTRKAAKPKHAVRYRGLQQDRIHILNTVDNPAAGFRCGQLGHRGFCADWHLLIKQPACAQHQQPGLVELGAAVGEHEARVLKRTYAGAKRLALPGVFEAELKGALCNADGLGGNCDPAGGDGAKGNAQALPRLSDQVCIRHPAAVEKQLRRAG